MNKNFEMGSIVTILIPQIDRNSVDRSLLPCKIIEKTNRKYRLGCASGILNVTYGANELNLVEAAEFPELDDIPQRTVSLREAARGQSVVRVTSSRNRVKCNCKRACTVMADVVVEKPSRVVQRNVIKIVLTVLILIIKLYLNFAVIHK